MYYRGGRGVVPPDESTSIRNFGDAYDGIRPGQMIVKFRGLAMSRGQPRKHMTWQENIGLTQYRLSQGGAVRRSSLRCAPFGPPTVSCVLAPARTCLRQAPPTSRGRGLATSAVPHRLTDDMSIKRAFILEKRCKKTSLFSPF